MFRAVLDSAAAFFAFWAISLTKAGWLRLGLIIIHQARSEYLVLESKNLAILSKRVISRQRVRPSQTLGRRKRRLYQFQSHRRVLPTLFAPTPRHKVIRAPRIMR